MKEVRSAAEKGQLDILKQWCLENADEINRPEPVTGQTLLHIAANHCQLSVVTYLLTLGIKINELDIHKNTSLNLCIQSHNKLEDKIPVIQYLLEAKADPLIENSEYQSSYMSFIKMCNSEISAAQKQQEPLQKINALIKRSIQDQAKTKGPYFSIRKNGRVNFFKTRDEFIKNNSPAGSPTVSPIQTPAGTPSATPTP